MIVTVIPTRGTLFSRTIESVETNLAKCGVPHLYPLFEHDKPIPDAQNALIERALAHSPDYIWMVEEDVVVPADGLKKMLAALGDRKVLAAKYQLDNGQPAYRLNRLKEPQYAGLGCMLARAEVFSQDLEPPWFKTSVSYTHDIDGTLTVAQENVKSAGYGRLDVHFYQTLKSKGILWGIADVTCAHLRVAEPGKPHSNSGCHRIVEVK